MRIVTVIRAAFDGSYGITWQIIAFSALTTSLALSTAGAVILLWPSEQ